MIKQYMTVRSVLLAWPVFGLTGLMEVVNVFYN